MSDDVVAVLQRAKEKVAAGWCQGPLGVDSEGRPHQHFLPFLHLSSTDSITRVCAAGAIYCAIYWPIDSCVVRWEDAAKYLRQAIGGLEIPEWNDAPERTQADVLDAFDRAIRVAKEPPPEPTDA